MSSHAVSHALRKRVGSATLKLVLLILSEYADEFGRVVITQKRLADESDLSARSVVAALKGLEDKAAIIRTRQVDSRGHRAPDLITIVGVAPVEVSPVDYQPQSLPAADACGTNLQQVQVRQMQVKKPHVKEAHVGQLHAGGKAMRPMKKSLPAADACGLPLADFIEIGDNLEIPKSSPPIVPPSVSAGDGQRAVEIYNLAAERAGWVAARGPHSEARKRAVKSRLREHGGLEGWQRQVDLAATMPFLGGDSERGWRMSLDWFVKPANWTKIAERNYAQREDSLAPKAPDDGLSVFRAACTYRQRSGEWPAPKGTPFDVASIPASVRAQFPELFSSEGRHA